MTALEKKLADALRAIVADVDAPGHTIRNVSAASVAAARVALADCDAPADPVRALVMRAALETYSENQYRLARDARNTRKNREFWGTGIDARKARTRHAQGCDARRRVADELLAELED
jgi:hypothetical protein